MILKAFSVYDSKAQAYFAPFFFPHLGQAIRAFMELANDQSTQVGRHPADFHLIELGEFDDATGTLTPGQLQNHGPAASFVQERTQPALPFVTSN